jgi:ribonucleoside-diphosphate reductase beta chain
MDHAEFSTSTHGLRRATPPMTLYEKAKRLGAWNPSDLDFSRDREDWQRLNVDERTILLHLTSMFVAGEEAVTLDLLPLMRAIAREGRIEEEMYLTTFLFEEAKHTDFFHRFLEEVGESSDLQRYHMPCFRALVCEALPRALHALDTDASPRALTRAATTYNLVVEGILGETGYHGYFTILDNHGILPAQRAGVALVKQDEARHIAYGIYLLSRLMAEDESLWGVIEETMTELLPITLSIVSETFASYTPVPFGLVESEFNEYAVRQFQKRLDRVQRARSMSLEQIQQATHEAIEADDA